jgi:N4-gp56 family major capsid protein
MLTVYGDISPRTAAYVVASLLKRALPYLVLEKFGQVYVIPNNKTKSAKFRRYEALALATTPLIEGVTPAGSTLTYTDYTANLAQYGDFVPLTDVIADTHEDPIFQQAQEIISEQAAQTIEAVRFGILKAGTNVFYANGVVRTDVNTVMTLNLQRKITRAFKRQNAGYITRVLSASPNYGTDPCAAGYVALCHPDCEPDIRAIDGFVPYERYSSGNPNPDAFEIGKIEDVRYIRSTVFSSWPDIGGAYGGTKISTSAVLCDVYPILFLAANAYGICPLKGKDSLTPIVLNPGMPSDSDPLGQRGYVGWKAMTTCVILNQLWMARAEVACTEIS